MNVSQPPPFRFKPEITLDEYIRLWKTSFKSIQRQFSALQRPRDESNIHAYLEELNAFDLAITEEDVVGTVWKDIHPQAEFRDEATRAQKAFSHLNGQVAMSSEIAENLDILSKTKLDASDSRRLLDVWKRNLSRGGAYLNPRLKEQVQNLTVAIIDAESEFLRNLQLDSKPLLLNTSELQGMPQDYLSDHPADSITAQHHIMNQLTDIIPVLDYCRNQTTREKALRFMFGLASPCNEHVLLRLLKLRQQKAQLLGYQNWAEYQLEVQMVKSVKRADEFISDCARAINAPADAELEEIVKLLHERDGIVAQPWDIRYGITLLQRHLIPDFDMKDTREYFPISRVFPAVQKIVQDLFSLRFEAMDGIHAWHPSVTSCLVYDTLQGEEKLIGRIFFDIYIRDGKIYGAAEYSVRSPVAGKRLAEVILFANVSSPTACVSLLEVNDLLHELGHCVHCLVGSQRYANFAGIGEPSRQKDFTEAPSMMLELWLEDVRSFDFAMNERGGKIPKDLLSNLLQAEQIGRYGTFPSVHGLSEQHNLWHLANPGYASLYYCYLYSRVISHDLFSEFVKSGDLMNKDVAKKYRKMVLEKGSSKDAEDMVNSFLGRQFNSVAYEDWLKARSRPGFRLVNADTQGNAT